MRDFFFNLSTPRPKKKNLKLSFQYLIIVREFNIHVYNTVFNYVIPILCDKTVKESLQNCILLRKTSRLKYSMK
jgi:hypothetical protein